MTREEQQRDKQARKEAKIALRNERKREEQEARNWQKMVIRWKQLGAWIEIN